MSVVDKKLFWKKAIPFLTDKFAPAKTKLI